MTVWIQNPFDSLPIEGYRMQRYWMMSEAFVQAGHRVVYWTSDFSHAMKTRRNIKTESVSGFEIRLVKTMPYLKNVSWQRVRSHRAYALEWERAALAFVKQSGDFPNVIITSVPPVSTGAVGVRLAQRFSAKLVVDVQDAWPETFYRLVPKCFRWLAWLLLSGVRSTMGHVYRQANLVTGVCDRYEALVKEYGAKEYYRAYLGIAESGIENRGPVIGDRRIRTAYVGNLGKSYDLKTAIEGVALLNQRGMCATLDVAGFGGTVAASDGVRFHGMLEQEKLRQLLEQCDVGVIPMCDDSYVGIPNKLAEYANAGLSIVSSLKGECADLLARYGCGVTYQSGDAVSFADAVTKSLALPASAGRRLVEIELAADVVYKAYCERICALVDTGKKESER